MQQQVQWALQHLTDDQHEQKDTSVGRRERRRGPTERATAAQRDNVVETWEDERRCGAVQFC